jgi:hypothetical protein
VRRANAALDDVRRRVQQQTLGHRGPQGRPGVRHPPVTAGGQWAPSASTSGGRAASLPGWPPGTASTADEVGATWTDRSCFAPCTPPGTSVRPAERRWRSTGGAPRSTPPRSTGWPAPFPRGRPRSSPTTPPGVVERPDGGGEPDRREVRRIRHGFRNFDNYRLRLLLRCDVTWHTRPAATNQRPSTTFGRVESRQRLHADTHPRSRPPPAHHYRRVVTPNNYDQAAADKK